MANKSSIEQNHIKRGIRWKLLTTMIGLTVVLPLLLTWIQITIQQRFMADAVEQQTEIRRKVLKQRGSYLADDLVRRVQEEMTVLEFGKANEICRLVVEEELGPDYVFVVGDDDDAQIEIPDSAQQIAERTEEYMAFNLPFKAGELQLVLHAGFSLKPIEAATAAYQETIGKQTMELLRTSILISIVFLLVGIVVSMTMSTRLVRPLTELTASARELAKGNFEAAATIKIESTDEIAVLASTFVTMANNVKESYEQLEEQHRVDKRTRDLAAMSQRAEHARASAEAANQTKTTFLTNMSHELRTPLNAIIGYSEMLEEDAVDEGYENIVPDLGKIHGAGRHLLGLINEILDLSKIEAGRIDFFLENVELTPIIEDSVSTIHPLIEKNANTLKLEIEADLGSIYTDVTRIRQCLFNLLSNASKFTKEGTITLSVSRESTGGREFVVISVDDTGIGMTKKQTEKIFEAFSQADVTTSHNYGGTGLGLTITRKIADMMGGDIAVKSEKNVGTTFTLRLPAQQLETVATDTPTVDASAKKPERKAASNTLLVIDDKEDPQQFMSRHLTKQGINVVTASNAEAGTRLAREIRPIAIMLDIIMLETDGWEVLSTLKADPDLADIPVIVVSMDDKHGLGFTLGAAKYLSNPIDKQGLEDIIGKFRNGQSGDDILVVEDDDAQREMLCHALQNGGWAVREASNGREALEALHDKVPTLIFLDLLMPQMDGFEFVNNVQQDPAFSGIPVIILTSKDLTREERKRLSGGVGKIIEKGSVGLKALLQEIETLVDDAHQR
jgi:signal transduction histidine kinase/CheY-like chemotaxis protein